MVTEHEGIVSLNIIPEKPLLVGLAYPSSDIVLYKYQAKRLLDIVPGIPWKLGNPLSREIIVTPNGHIYSYRANEDPRYHEQKHNVWIYDLESGEMQETGYAMTNSFWIGQTETRDGSKIYVSTTNGQLYEFDVASETFKDLGYMLPQDQIAAGQQILYTYVITLTPDEKKIVIILSHLDNPVGTGEHNCTTSLQAPIRSSSNYLQVPTPARTCAMTRTCISPTSARNLIPGVENHGYSF